VVYDTTAIVGAAFADPNFNLDSEGAEGSGSDRVSYLIPEGWEEYAALDVECTVWYQSLPPKWIAPTLAIQGDSLIDGFRQLYAEFAPTPERIATVNFTQSTIGLTERKASALTAFPNPSRGEAIQIVGPETTAIGRYQLVDAAGRLVEQGSTASHQLKVALPTAGRYILRTEQGQHLTLIRE